MRAELGMERVAHAGSARCARPVMPGAWLQTPAKTRLIERPHTPATFSSVDVVIA